MTPPEQGETPRERELIDLLKRARRETWSYKLVLAIDEAIGKEPLPPPGPCPECAAEIEREKQETLKTRNTA